MNEPEFEFRGALARMSKAYLILPVDSDVFYNTVKQEADVFFTFKIDCVDRQDTTKSPKIDANVSKQVKAGEAEIPMEFLETQNYTS